MTPNQVEWAKDYIEKYELARGLPNIDPAYTQLYNLAKAIIADVEGK